MKKKELQVADVTELARKAEQRKERRKRRKHSFGRRNLPANYFPFTPVRPDRPNFLGLNLEPIDCKILKAIQTGNARTIADICKFGRLRASKVYERFRLNGDLREALRLLVSMTFTLAAPGIVSDLVENAGKNAKMLELFLKCAGILEEPSFKLIQNFEPGLMSQWQVQELIGGNRK